MFTWLDALYFVSVTLATVGYGVSVCVCVCAWTGAWMGVRMCLAFPLFPRWGARNEGVNFKYNKSRKTALPHLHRSQAITPDPRQSLQPHNRTPLQNLLPHHPSPQDITPSSDLSRAVVIFAIFFFLCCIPYQISKLMEAISSKSIYRTAAFRPVRNTEHAVLLGRVTYPVRL